MNKTAMGILLACILIALVGFGVYFANTDKQTADQTPGVTVETERTTDIYETGPADDGINTGLMDQDQPLNQDQPGNLGYENEQLPMNETGPADTQPNTMGLSTESSKTQTESSMDMDENVNQSSSMERQNTTTSPY